MTKIRLKRIEGEKVEVVGEATLQYAIEDTKLFVLTSDEGAIYEDVERKNRALRNALKDKGVKALVLVLPAGDSIDLYEMELIT